MMCVDILKFVGDASAKIAPRGIEQTKGSTGLWLAITVETSCGKREGKHGAKRWARRGLNVLKA
jgi:hypothetical protein